MEQVRVVETQWGSISYLFIKKRVKNLNLHIRRDGNVVLSIPMNCPLTYADEFIGKKAAWIIKARERMECTAKKMTDTLPERDICISILREALHTAYPLVKPLGVAFPRLKVRKMTSQWGNCHYEQGYITLNLALACCPQELRVYVALHELVHFLYPNHGPNFYACMDHLMPEWKRRRAELKNYVGLLC